MNYSPLTGNEDKVKKELAERLAEEVKKNPKLTADEKKALEEKLKVALDKEIADMIACVPEMTEQEIKARKVVIKTALLLEMGLEVNPETILNMEVDAIFREEQLTKCLDPLYCAPKDK